MFVILPLLQPGLPGSADTPLHFYRALEFARSWGPGVIYPRWAPDLAYGYGYPLWNFAPPLPYLIPLAFRAAGLSLEASLKGFVILTALAYALGAYLFARDRLGPKAGLVAAAIYTLAPFALREVLLYGGNYPQYLAIGLYPWVLWALGRVNLPGGAKWPNITLAAIFYGALILSHLFHALVLTPVAAAYAGALWLSDRREVRRLRASALALGLGLLWTAFFWLPALIERRFTRFQEDVFLSSSPFSLRFLSWGELLAWPQALDTRAINPWVPFSLGPAALLLAGLGLLALVARRQISPPTYQPTNIPIYQPTNIPIYQSTALPTHHQATFFLGLLALCVFMVLPISNWVWANAPLLAIAEFPWRWLGLANLSLAFLGGASVHWLSPPKQTALAFGGTLAVLLTSAVYLYPPHPFVRYGETVADMASYELASQSIGTTTLAEYLPRWVTSVPDTSPLAEAMMRGNPVQKLDRASLPKGTTVRLLDHSATSVGYHFESLGPSQARFLTYYFPGWTARLDGQPAEITVEPESGLITVPVPAGSHELRLRFGDTPLRTVSNTVTALTLITLFIAGLARSARLLSNRTGNLQAGSPDSLRYQPPGTKSGWTLRATLLVGGGLVGLLLLKGLAVDPYTDYFRRESPPGRVSGAQHPMRLNLDDRFWLLGYDLDRDRVTQGGTLQVVLYWQAERPTATNFRSFVHLDAPTDQRTWAGSDNAHPGEAAAQIELPTSTWDTAHYVRDEHLVHIPPHVPPVSFDLRAGLYDPDTGQRLPIASSGGDTVELGAIQVTPGQGLRPAEVPNPVSYQLGAHIQLLGYDWDPGEPTLTLYWQSGQALETDYVVFVHLLDGKGQLAWGADAPPLGGLYPTSAWDPGAVIADPRPLALDGLPSGAPGPAETSPSLAGTGHTLAVGMYHPDTLIRLPVTDADEQTIPDNAIPLTRLTWP